MNNPQILTFKPGTNRDFAERLLGRRKSRAISRSTETRLEEGIRKLPHLLKPRLIYDVESVICEGNEVRLQNGTSLVSRKLAGSMEHVARMVFFVATVGENIDREIERLMGSGRLADACVMDALGSGAIEWVADNFQKTIEEELAAKELKAGLRFSPGYCDWPLPEQKKIFSLLNTGKVGVELDENCLMHPRKSISAVFGLYPPHAWPEARHLNPCRRCAKKDCLARRTAN